ncbi:MAG: N-acetylneuraminate synthase family protein [Phycisphaerae bacterium]
MTDDFHKSFRIGPATVGDGSPVYVIAEAGVNHDGHIDAARELIHAAANAEADAVKFQLFSADRLVTESAATAEYQKKASQGHKQRDMLARLELSRDQFAELSAYARYCDIEFLATPFGIDDLKFLVSIGVQAIKLASTDVVNDPLLDQAAASGLPVIASTGAATEAEIARAVERFKQPGAGPLALLHCVSCYPTPEAEANLRAIGALARRFDCVTGFSDHTESVSMGGYAAAAGARIIEKHLTLVRSRPGPDHAFSLEPPAMAEYIRQIRYVEKLLGDGSIGSQECEDEVRRLARGNIVSTRDIRAGEVLDAGMLTIKRAGGGLWASELQTIIGRQAKVDIAADTAIQRDWVS